MALLPHSHIERVIRTEKELCNRVSELAAQISKDFQFSSNSSPLFVIGVATGAFIFLADLVRKIELPLSIDFVRAESYGRGTVSNANPRISLDLKLDVKGKHILLVEDIVDTGNTLISLLKHLESKGASSVSVCTLLDKPSRRKISFGLVGKGRFYRGFECSDHFVVGYGLDFGELYRNLPYIGILKHEYYK